jgi:hypothetical protein
MDALEEHQKKKQRKLTGGAGEDEKQVSVPKQSNARESNKRGLQADQFTGVFRNCLFLVSDPSLEAV